MGCKISSWVLYFSHLELRLDEDAVSDALCKRTELSSSFKNGSGSTIVRQLRTRKPAYGHLCPQWRSGCATKTTLRVGKPKAAVVKTKLRVGSRRQRSSCTKSGKLQAPGTVPNACSYKLPNGGRFADVALLLPRNSKTTG